LIDNPIAVVIEAIADLDDRNSWHAVFGLAAHAQASAEAHSALGPNPLVDLAVAIVVEEIANFRRARVACGVEFGAIT